MNYFSDVVILTTNELKEIDRDDRTLVAALEEESLRVRLEAWEDYHPNPETESAVIFRSSWGYYKDLIRFKRLLKELAKTNLFIWNPLTIVRWNLDKKYLLELRKKSCPVIPTRTLEPTHIFDFQALSVELGTSELVIKPTVGAGSFNTFHIGEGTSLAALEREMKELRKAPILVQAYVPSIVEEGELSLIFIENEFTHCILKRPADHDFRVQENFGGHEELIPAPPAAVRIAKDILFCLDDEPLYARVDLVRTGGSHYQLMELELIEPRLWLAEFPRAASLLAQAISKRL